MKELGFTRWSIREGMEFCHLGLWKNRKGLTDEFYGFIKPRKRSIHLRLIPIWMTVQLQRLKEIKSSKEGMLKGYHFSMERSKWWQNTLHHFQKLEFFRPFKSNHTTPINCLDIVTGTVEKKKLVKLRISSHKLMIELLGGFKVWVKGVFWEYKWLAISLARRPRTKWIFLQK